MPELVVIRPRGDKDTDQDITILVDGCHVGRCKDGGGVRVEISEGRHAVQAVMAGSWKSPVVSVESVNGEPIELQCGVRAKDGPIRLFPGALTRERIVIAGVAVLAQYGYRIARDFVTRDDYLYLRAK